MTGTPCRSPPVAPPSPVGTGARRHRRPRARRLRAAARASASAWSPITPADRATAQRRSICCTRRRACTLVVALQPRARHPRHARRRTCRRRRTRRPACRFTRSTARRGGRPTRCSTGIDTLVIDLQDVGARFYTYDATMGYVMEEAAKRKIAVVVLDRPNPINGWQIEGPAAGRGRSPGRSSRICRMPIRHGMTLGELARLFNGERKIGADLTVVRGRELAARRLVRPDRAGVDQSVAEHAQPESGDALSGHRRDRVSRTSRSAAAPISRSSRSARRGSTAARWRRRSTPGACPGIRFYPDHLHADVEQVRQAKPARACSW